jgi:EAL domain-containing protein (putative c-di-GMP-specific phosphodiesterase class I)/ActR/RegA family two-component response regulator
MQKERLLIVGDDEAFTASISGIAALADYEVMTTGDPVVARALIGAWRPSVLTIDLLMAATHGGRLLRPLAAEGCATHVIISSGLGDSAPACALDIAAQHGCKIAGFLSKPLQAECCRDLLVQIKSAKDLTLIELREAFTKEQFFLEYQPQLDCRFNKIVGVEALVRWRHPEKGIIAPNRFIPLAAETELVDELTDWVFSTATKQVARWHDQGLSLQLAVNISVRNLENAGFARRLTKHCDTVGLEPRSVTLEIAEGNLLHDTSTLLKGLYELQFEEFGVAIDEFGTGYSSLVELRRLPLTAIKIDRSLVSRITNDSDCQRTVAIIGGIARKLELEAFAVGVENEQALTLIRAFGCGRAQGYHVSRPVPPELIPQTIDEWKSRSEQAVA